ncbi:hypothetical protein H4R33_007091 [Dimargaris cristalligena]|nr:hypothetical protein H4R33_007091 [Dimargaris cristalligena]
MTVTLKPVNFLWEGTVLITGLVLLSRFSPPDCFYLPPAVPTLAYLTAIAILILRRYRLGHHLTEHQLDKRPRRIRNDCPNRRVELGQLWLRTAHTTMWVIFGLMYAEVGVTQFAVYIDPDIPTSWHPWLISAMFQQAMVAFTVGVYYFLYSEADAQSIAEIHPIIIPHWLQLWAVALVIHTWELIQNLLSNWLPEDGPPAVGLFARRLTLGIAVTKLLLTILTLAIPLYIMWYYTVVSGLIKQFATENYEIGQYEDQMGNEASLKSVRWVKKEIEGCQYLLRLIDINNEIHDPDDAPCDWDITDGAIEFKDVHFGYNECRPS